MKVWQCDDSRPVPRLVPAEVETPQPGPGEVLVRVHAVGVTPTELSWQPTTHTKSGENRRHAIPAHEFSGTIAAVAAGADGAVGDEVFGMNDWYAQGATAEYCCALASALAPRPARLTHVEAASVPIAALTAWQGLFERARLQAGERVLIHGGAGAVGVFAIQLACRRGAHVLTTASGRDRDFLLRLGAQQVIDYHTERFEDVARNVDVVFDTVGGSTLQRSRDVLGPGGRLVTIVSTVESPDDELAALEGRARPRQAYFIVEPNRQQLCDIAAMLDAGQLQPVVSAVLPFARAAAAYAHEPMRNRRPGKTVVTVIPPGEPSGEETP
ncbi:MAG TPA: NADP-dependent oxidoreductase [Gemmataceae bacterium]|jgi:NADPH:quinone reductase-like Zn-dependent oxidoreductase|nr:NADP-dependent oxidoreductase [Gemmataceae bacterium]